MEFVWEEMFTAILDLPPDTRFMEMQEFLHNWINGISCKVYEEEIGLRKALESEMTEREIEDILENSGYIFCPKCRKIQEDDHKCNTG